MKRIALHTTSTLALLIAGILASGPALAEKPSWAGGGKGGKHQQKDWHDDPREAERGHDVKPSHDRRGHREGGHAHFDDQHRTIAHDYYSRQFRNGRCPPGLAKKDNGCLPPGQAKKQGVVGQPLPRNVTYYNVPPALVSQLPPPPAGYRYVRVENDVLMMSPRTRMVMDALRDLGSR